MAAGLLIAVPWSGAGELAPALAALTVCNLGLLKLNPLPPLYSTGVRYLRETVVKGRPKEIWLTTPLLYQRGFGDCEDLCTTRAAQLILQGIPARAVAVPVSIGWHIVVKWPDGRIEDPSRQLGM